MIYITGDCHGDWSKLSSSNFHQQKELTKKDYVIVCGDFGIWHDTNEERYWLKWLNEKPFTTLFIAGNHENYDRLYNDYPEESWHGGKIHKISDSIFHLMNGYVFDIDGIKIFAFGGASSHDIDDGILDRNDFSSDAEFKREYRKWKKQDKIFRVNHISWWQEEMPTKDEMNHGLHSLEAVNNKVDYIITHCAPQSLVHKVGGFEYKPDELTEYFDEIKNTVDFKKWYFGHYHIDSEISEKFTVIYNNISCLAFK